MALGRTPFRPGRRTRRRNCGGTTCAEYTPRMSLFDSLFEPRRIALIGASSDEKRTTSRPQRFLQKHGFKGEIVPVNPGRAEIFGVRAYKAIDDVPGEIDHAYIL